ncbi:MAG: hypothetical protein Kow0088_22880 [Anaerolineales bacterium]
MVKEKRGRLYQGTARLFAPDRPKVSFGRVATDFLQAEIVHKRHGDIEKWRIQEIKTSHQAVECAPTSLSHQKASPKRVRQV